MMDSTSLTSLWWENNKNGIEFLAGKESGTGEKVLDRRIWAFDSRSIAEKRLGQRIRQKTDPKRKSPRKYKITDGIWGS